MQLDDDIQQVHGIDLDLIAKRLIRINCLAFKVGRYFKENARHITIAQTRYSICERWGDTVRKDIESNAGTIVWFASPIDIAKELEVKSGTKTVLTQGAKDGDSGHVGKSISEVSVPNLHASKTCFLPGDKAILEIKGVPGLVLADATPWWEIELLNRLIDLSYRDDEFVYEDL